MTKDELCRLEQPKLVKLIDEGKLVYLPCKTGDNIFIIGKLTKEIFKLTVIGFTYFQGKITLVTENGMTLTNYYLTPEEAEAKLKEMEEK